MMTDRIREKDVTYGEKGRWRRTFAIKDAAIADTIEIASDSDF